MADSRRKFEKHRKYAAHCPKFQKAYARALRVQTRERLSRSEVESLAEERLMRSDSPVDLRLRFITPDDSSYADELDLRFRVLREPLGQTRADVLFSFEGESLHLVAQEESRMLGCVLFHPEGATDGRLFQMAVAPDAQRLGLGRKLVEMLEQELRSRGVERIHLHARAQVVGFYERLGYSIYGEPFVEIGIEHRHMQKKLKVMRREVR
jgi:ribosomal protein S18 acetylase RimI-like enzyme